MRMYIAIGAGVLLNMCFGLMYAWSVFIDSLGQELDVGRGLISLVFSAGIASLTIGFFISHSLYSTVRLSYLIGALSTACALGLVLAGAIPRLEAVIIGFGGIFGLASGVGYMVALQIAANALAKRAGLFTGITVAAFAAGAVIFSKLCTVGIETIGARNTFLVAAAVMAALGLLIAIALAASRLSIQLPRANEREPLIERVLTVHPKIFLLLWIGFAFGCLAGLVGMSHATGIIAAFGGSSGEILLGPITINVGYIAGGIAMGWSSDRLPVKLGVVLVLAIAGVSILAVGFTGSPIQALIALGFVGVAYGGMTAVYAVAIRRFYGRETVGRIFGRLLSAWGVAGLLAPWLAGVIYDLEGEYATAVTYVAIAAGLAVLVSLALPRAKHAVEAK